MKPHPRHRRLVPSNRPLLAIFLLALLVTPAGGIVLRGALPPEDGRAAVRLARLSFTSGGGTTIRVDRFTPKAAEPVDGVPRALVRPRRAILVLHGAGGMLLDGPEMRRVARRLAESGDAAYVVHYFNRTGTFAARDPVMQEFFETWRGTVRDAVGFVQREEGNARPVGVYGYSLGGFLALAAASDEPRIGAVVEQAGGVWNGKEGRIGRMPPVLMIHGREDARVPFAKYAVPLEALLRQRGREPETRFVAGEGHGFKPPAQAAARDAAAGFFARRLGGG